MSTTATERVPVELSGQIRSWRARLDPDAERVMAAIKQALAPLIETSRSKAASDWLIRRAAQRWQVATNSMDRISFVTSQKSRHVRQLTEVRAFATAGREPDWALDEQGLSAIAITARIERRQIDYHVQPVFSLSDHALARHLQREPGCTIARALREAVDALSWALGCFTHQTRESGTTPSIIVPTPTGYWVGYLDGFRLPDSDRVDPMPMLRSWLPDEAIDDEKFLRALAVLRQAGDPLNLDDAAQAALRLALARTARRSRSCEATP